MGKVSNYARFWAAFNKVRCPYDKEDFRKDLIYDITAGRTDSLKEMSYIEYCTLCREVEKMISEEDATHKKTEERRKLRSECLRQMQLLGVYTAEWEEVDKYCLSPKICGKPFNQLTIPALKHLKRKLHAIRSKVGRKPPKPKQAKQEVKPYIIVMR